VEHKEIPVPKDHKEISDQVEQMDHKDHKVLLEIPGPRDPADQVVQGEVVMLLLVAYSQAPSPSKASMKPYMIGAICLLELILQMLAVAPFIK
jgi:hypothetical protein